MEIKLEIDPNPQAIHLPTESQPPKQGRGHPYKYPKLTAIVDTADILIYLQEDALTQYHISQQKELTGLLEKGVFEVIKLIDIPNRVRLFNS